MEQKRTHTNSLTEEAIEQLRKNTNVRSVSRSAVKFTPEFKERFTSSVKPEYRRMRFSGARGWTRMCWAGAGWKAFGIRL